jgi:hypothetical protein
MKKILCLALLAIFFAAGVSTAEVPNLIGNWTGSWGGYVEGKGYSEMTKQESMIFAFTEQKGRIFAGNLTIKQENEPEINEGFAGAVGLDNKTLYIVEFLRGYALATIISEDKIDLVYLADGENATVSIDELHRATG